MTRPSEPGLEGLWKLQSPAQGSSSLPTALCLWRKLCLWPELGLIQALSVDTGVERRMSMTEAETAVPLSRVPWWRPVVFVTRLAGFLDLA